MTVNYQLTLTPTAKRLSDVYGGTPSQPSEQLNVPYRQITLLATVAAAIGNLPAVTTSTGFPLAVGVPLTIGPFETGPVKLSDLYASAASGTLNILVVPF